MTSYVDVTFDCLPMRCIRRLDIPLDASPKYRQRCLRLKAALEKHGSHNSYYLYNASCNYHLTNDPEQGAIRFRFEGTVLTDAQDLHTASCDLVMIELEHETCDWLTEPVVQWFADTVPRSVTVEFDRYIEAGDLEQTKQRVEEINAASDESGGFVGMYL